MHKRAGSKIRLVLDERPQREREEMTKDCDKYLSVPSEGGGPEVEMTNGAGGRDEDDTVLLVAGEESSSAPAAKRPLGNDLVLGCVPRQFSWRDPRAVLTGLCLALLVVVVMETMVTGLLGGGTGVPHRDDSSGPHKHEGDSLGEDYEGRPRVARGSFGVVAADQGDCSEIGAEALRRGGHAVDATVATAFCLGVKNPFASGIGGGAFILIRLSNGTAHAIDAREEAPGGATEDMFVDDPKKALEGGLAVAVPMEILGLHEAWQMYGRLPWWDLVMPAADLASGFRAHPYLVKSVESHREAMERHPPLKAIFMPQGKVPKLGETCCGRPKLAETLRRVAEEGPGVLYDGDLAEGLAADVRAAGGILTAADLAQARPRLLRVLESEVMGRRVAALPPPSSGAVAISILKQIEARRLPVATSGALGKHRLVEAMKNSFAVRMSLGDPGREGREPFLDLKVLEQAVGDLLSPEFAKEMVEATLDNATRPAMEYGGRHNPLYVPTDNGTSHLCVVDGDQNAVSMTTTINTGFGSKVVSETTGVFLNNEMDDFSIPGKANVYGLAPSEANYVRPGKKPLSSMSPLIVTDGATGDLRMVVGASGGPRIITAVVQAFLGHFDLRLDPLDVIQSPRVHSQLFPEKVFVEKDLDPKLGAYLGDFGHVLQETSWGLGNCQMVVSIDGRNMTAVSDHRKDGAPAAV